RSRADRAAAPSDGPLASLPVGIAQLALVELAVGVAGHLGHEVDRLRHLELRQLVAGEGEDLVRERGARLDTRRGLDDRLHLFAPVLVRDAEDGRVSYL